MRWSNQSSQTGPVVDAPDWRFDKGFPENRNARCHRTEDSHGLLGVIPWLYLSASCGFRFLAESAFLFFF